MKKINKFILLSLFAVVAVAASSKSYAMPAFARQVGVSCSACHFQHFPELNSFGRAFKAGGYAQTGGTTTLIEDDNLSLPTVLNATFVAKLRDIKTNGSSGMGTDNSLGNVDLPDEASIILAGRGGEHIGFLAEIDAKGGLANLKVPIGWEVGEGNIAIVPFTSAGNGAPEGFELLNTGALGSVRAFEDAVRAGSAARYLNLTDAPDATGVALVYANPLFFVNITPFEPSANGGPVTSFAYYARAAVTPQVAGWDLGLGVQYWGGTYEGDTKATTTTTTTTTGPYSLNTTTGEIVPTSTTTTTTINTTKQDANAMVIDAQAMGQVSGMPIGVFLSYGSLPKYTGSNKSMYADGNTNDETVTSISAELGVHPKFTVGAAYRAATNGSGLSDNAAELIGTYKLAQNIQVGLTYANLSGDAHNATDAATPGDGVTSSMMINIFAAF